MMTNLLYSINILCQTGSSGFAKYYAKNGGKSSAFNISKAISGFVLFAVIGLIQGFRFHLPTVLFGVGYGVFLCASMYSGFKALSLGPIAVTSIAASFSLLIPFFFGIFFWNESLTVFGICGILLTITSFVLIVGKKVGGISGGWLIFALITLVTNGFGSVIQKYHQMKYPGLYRIEFMVFSMLTVLIVLSVSMCFNRQKSKAPPFCRMGLAAGAFECLANYIVLFLSATENASVLFPIVSMAKIISVWIVGIVFFKEKLTVLQTLGLILGVAAIVILKI